MCTAKPLTHDPTENHPRHLQSRERAPRGLLRRHGRCTALHGHLSRNILLRLGHELRRRDRLRLPPQRQVRGARSAHHRANPDRLRRSRKSSLNHTPTKPHPLTSFTLDHLLPRRHPLGPRVLQIRRRPRLPPLRHRRLLLRRRLAHPPPPSRVRANLAIPHLQLPLLHRRPRLQAWLDAAVVRRLPLRPDVYRR